MNTELTNTEVISSKMMRPRRYAERMGINYRTFYDYLYRGAIPYYKFQGILLIDVEEADAIIKGLLKRVHADHGIAKTGKKRDRDATSSTLRTQFVADRDRNSRRKSGTSPLLLNKTAASTKTKKGERT